MLPPLEHSHDKSLDTAIADMATVLLADLALVDGTTAMEGLGPSAGVPRQLDVVLAGVDTLAADAVACALMGRDADDMPHLRIAAERGCGIIDLDSIDVTPEDWRDHAQTLTAPPKDLSIEFPNVNVLDNQSCSSCQSTLLLFLRRHGEELAEYLPEGQSLNVAIGKGHTDVPENTLCIGNCTIAHRDRGIFVSGCPPVGSQILAKFKEAQGR